MSSYVKQKRLYAIFVLGLLSGSIFFLIINGMKIQHLKVEIGNTYYALNQKDKEIHNLQYKISRLQKHGVFKKVEEDKIQNIDVEILSSNIIASEIIKTKLSQKLISLVNKSFRFINQYPDLIDILIEQEPLNIDEITSKRLQAKLHYAVFYQSTLKIWVKIEEMPKEILNNYLNN